MGEKYPILIKYFNYLDLRWHTFVTHLVLDLEEEHPFPLRPGDDARAGVAQSHRTVAPRRYQTGGQGM